jgi:hypothetical protein
LKDNKTLREKIKILDRSEDEKQLKLLREQENVVSVFPRITEVPRDLQKLHQMQQRAVYKQELTEIISRKHLAA